MRIKARRAIRPDRLREAVEFGLARRCMHFQTVSLQRIPALCNRRARSQATAPAGASVRASSDFSWDLSISAIKARRAPQERLAARFTEQIWPTIQRPFGR